MKRASTPPPYRKSPRDIVADKCIAFMEALLRHRRTSLSNNDVERFGQDLLSFFRGIGAVTPENAFLAARSINYGIVLLGSSTDSPREIIERIQNTYRTFVDA